MHLSIKVLLHPRSLNDRVKNRVMNMKHNHHRLISLKTNLKMTILAKVSLNLITKKTQIYRKLKTVRNQFKKISEDATYCQQ